MSRNQNNDSPPSYYDNSAYVKDGDDPPYSSSIPVEPAPHKFLPRIITGSEIGGQKPKTDIVGSPEQPRFTVKNNEPGQISTISHPSALENGNDDDEEDRDTWDNPIEFLLSCISMSVGLGNVWRFPGTAARNGGGAFLIPYILVLLFIGRPLYYLEMCLGQFSRFGQVKVWNMAPMFKGVGYGSITGVICVCSYYCSIMAVTVYYFIASFAKDLPWAKCHPDKHSENCTESEFARLYYDYTVFPKAANIDDGLGTMHWQLVLCLAFSWLLIFGSLVKGVKSSGKVAYFTAIFPYVVLLILLIRGVTLKGAWNGIKIFLEPQWSELKNPKVWYAAVEQCFFSLSTGFGPVIMFSSYNGFKQNVYKDALIISFMDTFTSLIAGITVFAVIGNLMETNPALEIEGGPGLAFVLYPQAIATFDWVPQLFAVLFFLMLFTLGIGSATSLTGGVITIICDQFPSWKRWLVTLIVCVCGCLLGLMYVTEGGLFMLDLIDHYGSGFVIYVMAMLECAGVSYVYGLGNFCNDIEFMLGRKVGIYWRLCWGFIIPIGLFANLLYYLISEPEYTSGGVPYPQVATICGWLLTAFAVALIPAWGIHAIATRKASTVKEKFFEALRPTPRWGPQKPKLRREWLEFRAMRDAEGSSRKRFLIF